MRGCPTRQQPLAFNFLNRERLSCIRPLLVPLRWYSGNTETGPRPYQFVVPSEIATGENAIYATTRLSTSATKDTGRAYAARSASIMNHSVWLLISMLSKAATVTSVMTSKSAFVSSLITIFCVIIAIAFRRVSYVLINAYKSLTY